MKKCSIFIVVLLSGIIDIYILRNGAVIFSTTMLFYLFYEEVVILISILKIGVPFPKILKSALEQILADLIAQGYSGDDLLARFKIAQKEVRPAVEEMLAEAEQVAGSKSEFATYEDVFGAEEEE